MSFNPKAPHTRDIVKRLAPRLAVLPLAVAILASLLFAMGSDIGDAILYPMDDCELRNDGILDRSCMIYGTLATAILLALEAIGLFLAFGMVIIDTVIRYHELRGNEPAELRRLARWLGYCLVVAVVLVVVCLILTYFTHPFVPTYTISPIIAV